MFLKTHPIAPMHIIEISINGILFLKRSSIKAYNKLTVHRVKTNHNGVAHIEEFPNMKILKKLAHKEHMKFDVIPTKFNVFSILINKGPRDASSI